MGLDIQNLAYHGQNLDQFGPNLAIWSNLLVFEPQTSYLCQRNLIAIENNHWVRFQKFGLPDQKFGPIWPKFGHLGQSISFWATDLISSVRDFEKFYKDIEQLNVLAFGERLNLKSQEKTIQSVHSYWYGTRL